METLKAIFTRRSVREFKQDLVSEADVHDLLRAGMQAPSARNEQPWHFIVIDDPALLHAIPEFHPYSKMLLEAPLAILVCSDHKLESKRTSWVLDCSAATQNILLAAHAKGLGAVWVGIFPNAERVAGMQSLLEMPEDVQPVALVAVGHPAATPEPADRFKKERVHQNKWGARYF
ncbi:MAG: nitroreductase family protein [Chloroflexi bacterium]|nr:nitroreductase family protein [Chloroflexota bacterium]